MYQESTFTQSPLFYSLEAFAYNSHQVKSAVEDFLNTFGEADAETLADYLADQLGSTNSLLPAADATAAGFRLESKRIYNKSKTISENQ